MDSNSGGLSVLHATWQQAWADLGLSAPAGLLAQLQQAYQEPQRHYHTLQHLEECLALFDRHAAQQPGAVALALWFHDAVYAVRGGDNELRSADWAVAALQQAGAAQTVQARVHSLILATRHEAVPTDGDERLLVDIDLAILGASAPRFAEYNQQIRAEYAWVPEPLYTQKRREVLQAFLQRPHIYGTPAFQQRFEAAARANLAGALA